MDLITLALAKKYTEKQINEFLSGETTVVVAADIVDDLTTGGSDKVLSAEQGKVLGTQISQLSAQAGDAPLTTTAQTLSGAVNEVDAAVDANTASISQLTDNGAITATVVLTQTEYDALVTPDPTTIYIVVGA